jgi:hypothetical protein
VRQLPARSGRLQYTTRPRRFCLSQDARRALGFQLAKPIGGRNRDLVTYSPHLFDMSEVPVSYSMTLYLYADRKREPVAARSLRSLKSLFRFFRFAKCSSTEIGSL